MTPSRASIGASSAPAAQEPAAPDGGASFRGILKASALIGASSVINIGLGAVRMKAAALLLGPAGVGLLGAFSMVLELARSVAQFGMNGSGVRQIADASSSGETRRLAVTVVVLRRVVIVCALLGAALLALSSDIVSRLTFGTDEHSTSISLLAIALLLGVLASGQSALLQGTRKVAEQAKVTVFGALVGTVATVLIIYIVGMRGLAASLVATAAGTVVMSWWYSSKVPIAKAVLAPGEASREVALLLKLGLAFLASGLLTLGAPYAVRTFVLRTHGLEAAGMYQAAWTLGGLYVGFVLQALSVDFFPRLVGVANDHRACNAVVNDQVQASMLLAAPGIVATIAFAPLVIHVFYSAEFGGAIDLLRWMCLGMALRVISWPVGGIVIAKNRQIAFFAIDAAWAGFNVAATWWCLRIFGLNGAGIAFLLSYVFHLMLVYPTARYVTGFRWSRDNLLTGTYFVLTLAVAFVSQRFLPQEAALVFGACLTLGSAWYCARTLVRLSAAEDRLRGIARLFRFRKTS